ncbi:MAG: ATP-binding cassette domain-containing protein [Spirochaetales bacterium]|nr:ATP-binding cassette domain-containing protein [Spirochaetales bacterium]
MSGKKIVLRLEQIHHFSRNSEILNSLDFNLFEGEIHALVGNHLSGKSTVGKIIAGSEKIQGGALYVKGKQVVSHSIQKALKMKIAMCYQHQNIVPAFNSIDNIFFGNHPNFFITKKDKEKMFNRAKELLERFECNIDLDKRLYKINELDRQVINLCRVLILEPEILIVDEIGENMPPGKLEITYEILREMRDRGSSIIYITSNFKEVFKIADRVTILNDGYRKATEEIEALNPMKLVDLAFETSATPSGGTLSDVTPLIDSYQESIIDALPIGEILVNNRLEIVFANIKARELLKIISPRRQLMGLERVFKFLNDSEFFELIYAIDSGTDLTLSGIRFESNILKIVANPILDLRKVKIGTNIFIEDVSFDYQTREYLMQAKKVENAASLAAGVAHEIKNPLGIVQNYVELLKLDQQAEESFSYLNSIEKELVRITKIVDNLLSYTRTKKKEIYEPIKINELLDEVVLLLEHRFSRKDIYVGKKLAGDPIVLGDENKLKQLFMNLLVNSIEAVLEEGYIGVSTSTNRQKQSVQIKIEDNGFGISESIRDEIFSPFFTTKVTRTNIGLGLSICQNIVESHKGAILYSSVPGKNTIFTIVLPLIPQKEQPLPSP